MKKIFCTCVAHCGAFHYDIVLSDGSRLTGIANSRVGLTRQLNGNDSTTVTPRRVANVLSRLAKREHVTIDDIATECELPQNVAHVILILACEYGMAVRDATDPRLERELYAGGSKINLI